MRWRAFPLHPETPEEGRLLQDMFRTSPEKIDVMMAQLQATARSLGLPFGTRTRTYNSRLAQELGLWAEDQGKGDAYHMAAFRAYFETGQNLAKLSVLLDLADDIGLSTAQAEAVLTDRTYRENVDQDWADSRFKGITAVPTFVMGQHKVVGARPYNALVQLVVINGAEKKRN